MSVSEIRLQAAENDHHYKLTLTPGDGGHHVELTGADAHGQILAEWHTAMPLPMADLAVIAQLLAAGINAASDASAARTLQERRRKHANSHQPWTAEDDQRLAKLAAQPDTTIQTLMTTFGRSRGAIRSRLERKQIELRSHREQDGQP
ncbi:hypothetical protein [Nonomuraea sp. NPDC023979]|uniref:hypothetical protein n=1 Tax=Nonomuraea sp. NPDC023979 TaxID=3154796 RepID=UPI00340FAB5F